MRKLLLQSWLAISVLAGFSVTASGKPVDLSRAGLVARRWYEIRFGAAKESHLSGPQASPAFSVDTARPIVVRGITIAHAFDTPGGGCMAIAADDELPPILYYSVCSRLTIPAVPPAQAIMEAFADRIANGGDQGDDTSDRAHPLWLSLSGKLALKEGAETFGLSASGPLGPLLTTAWSQQAPFKDQCPIYKGERLSPGCVAIAMAQVVRYWQHPLRGTGSHCYQWSLGARTLCADFASTTYDWTNMPDKADSTSPQAFKNALATVCYHCAVAAETQFTPNGSAGACDGKALTEHFGYKYTRFLERADFSDSQWCDLMSSQIDSGQPVLYRIEYKGAGHAVVLDGYERPNLFHLNMGWAGYQDGWYAIGSSYEVSDLKNWAVIDIRPHRQPSTYYVNGSTGDDAWHGTAPVWDGGMVGPKKTIQAAIDVTGPRDTVIVAEGTYRGPGNRNIDLGDRLITLRSASGPANCIIDCEREGRGFHFDNGSTELATLDGFTIRNGKADYGGAIFCWYGSPTIMNCIISGNTAKQVGGGLYGCNGTVQNCLITGNSAEFGGGLAFCDGAMRNCVISENTAGQVGGGLYDCSGTIQNNTIAGNSAQWGGGLANCEGPISNCIIWGNRARYGPPSCYESSSPTYSCIQGWTGASEKTISLGPRFVQGSYRLEGDSPCIDAGKNEDWMWQAVDLDGNPRIFPGASTLAVDMGAYEYGSFHFRLVSVARTPTGKLELTWTSRPGDTYAILSCLDLSRGDWIEQMTIASQGGSTTWSDPDMSANGRFYRIRMLR